MFSITPFYPTSVADDLADAIVTESAYLHGMLTHGNETRVGVANLMHRVNSYYSNYIEGGDASPYSIDRAMQFQLSSDSRERQLQDEGVSLIKVGMRIDDMLTSHPGIVVTSPEFIKYIHKLFYQFMPELDKEKISSDGKLAAKLIPGEFRKDNVKVSQHLAPSPDELNELMRQFSGTYKVAGDMRFMAVKKTAAAHHRFLYCHPFLDGNGRVGRLLSEAMLHKAGIDGHSLWSISRGLARNVDDYRKFLAEADGERWSLTDGRGVLSQKGLDDFCQFFMGSMLDQIRYMSGILNLKHFEKRVDVYVNTVRSTAVDTPSGLLEPLRPESARVLKSVFIEGSLARGEIPSISGLEERTARKLTRSLLDEGLLVTDSDTHKGHLTLGFSPHFVTNLFPDLYPEKYLMNFDNDDFSLSSRLRP